MQAIGNRLTGGLLLAALALMAPAMAMADKVATSEEAASTASVRDIKISGDTVHGTIVNNSHRPLREVRLLIRHAWLWKNERNPGHDNPGRTEPYVVAEEIPAGGTKDFTYVISPPLPERSDGRFVTTVELVGFTEVGF
jgi:hypothetical protein